MITKITNLKNSSSNEKIISLCENAISALGSTIYNSITPEAKAEIENITIRNLFEGLNKIKTTDKNLSNWLDSEERIYSIKNIGVLESINSLSQSEGKTNPGLLSILEDFKDKIFNNIHEVLLYEAYIDAVSGYSYFPDVNTSISNLKDKISKYKNDVDITKIIETMKQTRSNYLIPLIEDVVNDYLTSKTEQSKSFVKEVLCKFSYDPFIRDLINLVTADSESLQLEYANATCEFEKVYSPILYLAENECVFNVKGTYYIKKSNTINKLDKASIANLDSEFKAICETINRPNVVISDDNIKVYKDSDVATITETYVKINDKELSLKEFAEAAETSEWSGKTEFFAIVEAIRRNYSEIADINFCKRVYLKENENFAADVFKVRDNVIITTFNPELGKSTIYRNINSIQAKNILKEHLNYDISKLFEDLLPTEQKIVNEITETKKEYEDYISLLESKINDFSIKESNNTIISIIEALNEELIEVKNDYKDYLHLVNSYTHVNENNEPIEIIVKRGSDKYIVPIPTIDSNTETLTNSTEETKEPEDFDTSNTPASAVTFDDNVEALEPEISDKAVELEMDADKAEIESETEKEETKEEDKESEEPKEEEQEKSGEEGSEEAEAEDEEKKETEEEKQEESVNDSLQLDKKTFVKEGRTPKIINKKKVKSNAINESQILDTVIFNKQKAFIVGQMSNGDYIVQVSANGSTQIAKPNQIKDKISKKDIKTNPQFKFDKTTQKLLFEQLVKCGIYVNNTPIKTNNCFVRYSDWSTAKTEDPINVIVEGETSLMTKSQIKILEDVNNFANETNYRIGYIVNESGYAIEQILLNEEDYLNSIGDSDPVRTIRKNNDNEYIDTLPASSLSIDEPIYKPIENEYVPGIIKDDNGEVTQNILMNVKDYMTGNDENLIRYYIDKIEGEPMVLPKKQIGAVI